MNNLFDPEQYARDGFHAGCPPDQIEHFIRAGIILQQRQLAASAAARLCDRPDGPSAIGYGGARGGGKSYWLLAQMGADDCQRFPGLKCLLLRKSNKANKENLEDYRKHLFAHLPHTYNATTGVLTFANGSVIIAKHYQHEKEINDSFLGLEYDVIGVEEATTLTRTKWEDIKTCCRSSKLFPPSTSHGLSTPNSQPSTSYWRPRIYSTTNPGGVGHDWYRQTFIIPCERACETTTRFIPARVQDNLFTNPEYKHILAAQTGWKKRAWCDGDWDIAAGQFFHTFRSAIHVTDHIDESRAVEWLSGMDYGYTHYTVVLLGFLDADGSLYIVDEHAERGWVPQRHVPAIKAMFQRHRLLVGAPSSQPLGEYMKIRMRFDPPYSWRVSGIAAGGDLFSHQYDGSSIAAHFRDQGLRVIPANTNRVQGWAEIARRLGDLDAAINPTLFIHPRCARLLDCLPFLQHDPDQPADVLKTNPNEEGLGGDDAADALRYLVATPRHRAYQTKLRGL